MKYDYEKALNDAMNRVMGKTEVRLGNMRNWFIHDFLCFHTDIPYDEVTSMELRAFGCVGGH